MRHLSPLFENNSEREEPEEEQSLHIMESLKSSPEGRDLLKISTPIEFEKELRILLEENSPDNCLVIFNNYYGWAVDEVEYNLGKELRKHSIISGKETLDVCFRECWVQVIYSRFHGVFQSDPEFIKWLKNVDCPALGQEWGINRIIKEYVENKKGIYLPDGSEFRGLKWNSINTLCGALAILDDSDEYRDKEIIPTTQISFLPLSGSLSDEFNSLLNCYFPQKLSLKKGIQVRPEWVIAALPLYGRLGGWEGILVQKPDKKGFEDGCREAIISRLEKNPIYLGGPATMLFIEILKSPLRPIPEIMSATGIRIGNLPDSLSIISYLKKNDPDMIGRLWPEQKEMTDTGAILGDYGF